MHPMIFNLWLKLKTLTKADVGLGNVTDHAQLRAASNLSDLPSAATARTNLGLGNVTNDAQLKAASNLSDLPNAATARTNLGLGSVTNDAQLKAASNLSDVANKGTAKRNLDVDILPVNAKSANYTLVAGDTGKLISASSGTITVPQNVFSAGEIVTLYNNNSASRTIAQGFGVTMYWAGGATGNRTLAGRGIATVVCVASNTFVISGQGLS
jgi:hypothetical protein